MAAFTIIGGITVGILAFIGLLTIIFKFLE